MLESGNPENHGVARRELSIIPDFPNSSQAIFSESIAHIRQDTERSWHTVFTAAKVASCLADVDENAAKILINRIKQGVAAKGSSFSAWIKILEVEMTYGFEGVEQTIDKLFDYARSDIGEKMEGRHTQITQTIAKVSADKARQVISERVPWYEDDDMQLHIAEKQLLYDEEGAGKAASEYLEKRWDFWQDDLRWDPEKNETRMMPVPRHPDSKRFVAEVFGWLVARHGDIELAKQMVQVLPEDSVEKAAILGEIAARDPLGEESAVYLSQAQQLLQREGLNVEHLRRLSEAFRQTNPQLSEQFMTAFEESDYMGLYIPASYVKGLLTSGSFIEASRIIRTILQKDAEDSWATFPRSGPTVHLEQMLEEVASINPQRVVALVEDNFTTSRKVEESDVFHLKINLLLEGAKALIEAGEAQAASELLSRALLKARSIIVTVEAENEKQTGSEIMGSDMIDANLMDLKAITLAKVAAVVARLEKVSVGL